MMMTTNIFIGIGILFLMYLGRELLGKLSNVRI